MIERMYTKGGYFQKHPTWHVEDSAWKARQILRIIEKNHVQPKSVCEVGCGAGEILSQLYQHMPEDVCFVGYEISPQAFELCQSRKRDRLRFHLGDLLQDDEAGFDLVLAIDVVEHVEDCYGFLRALRHKGDRKIFHIPLDLSALRVAQNFPMLQRQAHGHIHYFQKETALAALADTGYQVLDYSYTPVIMDFGRRGLKPSLGRLARRIVYRLNADTAVRLLGGYSLMVLAK